MDASPDAGEAAPPAEAVAEGSRGSPAAASPASSPDTSRRSSLDVSEPPSSSAAVPLRERLPFLSWLAPTRGSQPVFETGVEYSLSLRCDSDEVQAVTFTLFDASTFKSWCAASRGRSCAAAAPLLPTPPRCASDTAPQVERDDHSQSGAGRRRCCARFLARAEGASTVRRVHARGALRARRPRGDAGAQAAFSSQARAAYPPASRSRASRSCVRGRGLWSRA